MNSFTPVFIYNKLYCAYCTLSRKLFLTSFVGTDVAFEDGRFLID